MTETYTDGLKIVRCETCRSALRQPGGKPLAYITVEDLESVISILVEYVDCPSVWAETIHRLEQAAGRTHAQMAAARREAHR